MTTIQNILVPTDFSAPADAALRTTLKPLLHWAG